MGTHTKPAKRHPCKAVICAFRFGALALGGVCLLAVVAQAQVPEQYPKPLLHTAVNHPAQHILLVSVDGLHAFDLANYVTAHPRSALAVLSAKGVTYTNAHAPWADPTAAFVSLMTGGTPISTGITATHSWDHSLSPAGSSCKSRGTLLSFDSAYTQDQASLDPAHNCQPVPLYALLRVNTIFEVVHSKIGPTAWAGENFATTDLLRGPLGAGLSEAVTNLATDDERIKAVLGWINAKEPPVLFGLSLRSFFTSQSIDGYLGPAGTPSPGLTKALDALDVWMARLSAALAASHLADSTWVVIVGPYGQSRLDPTRCRVIHQPDVAATLAPIPVARVSGGDIATIWLQNPTDTASAVRLLDAKAAALGIADILSGPRLALIFNTPQQDPRAPDIVLQPDANTIYAPAGTTPIAAHGGLSDWDTHVALLISGPGLTGRTDPTWVPTTQLGPLLLRALGMEKFDLDALHREHTPALPGIF